MAAIFHRMHIDPAYPWRREKRFMAKIPGMALEEAYQAGCYASLYRPDRPNPFKPGRRHEAWNQGALDTTNGETPWSKHYI